MSLIRSVFLAGLAAASLSACEGAARLDAKSYATLNASFNKARTSLNDKDRKRFDESRRKFNNLYFPSGEESPRRFDMPDWHVVHNMTAGEFHSFMLKLKPREQYVPGATFPDGVLAGRLLKQYEWEHELLLGNRQRVIDAGRNTEDQYPIVDFAYVPPSDAVPFEFDKASFLVTLRNDSGYDAYNPSFRISITKPGDTMSTIDRTFKYEERKPIGAGETRTLKFECCSVATDPASNKLLKSLSSDSAIAVDIVSVMNHTNLDLLNRKNFTMDDSRRLNVLELCIKRMKADLANWVPYAEADKPGGCGDPNQAENLLAMWRDQGVAPPKEFAHLAPDAEIESVASTPEAVTTTTRNADGTVTTTTVRQGVPPPGSQQQVVADATQRRLNTTRAESEAEQARLVASQRRAATAAPAPAAPSQPAAVSAPAQPSRSDTRPPISTRANRGQASLLPQQPLSGSEPLLGSGPVR